MKLSLNSWVVALCLVLIASGGNAADITWNRTTTATGNDWSNTNYWNGGVLPGPADRAYFPSIAPTPTNNCYPTLSNNAVVSLAGIYIDGIYSTAYGWQILNADSNNPARIVLGSMGISNRYRCGGGVAVTIQPDIQLVSNQVWQIDPDYNDAGPVLYGNLLGTGSLTRGGNSGGGSTIFQRRASPTFSGGLTVALGNVQWNQVNLTNTDAGAYGFGTGPITLAGGSFIWSCTALPGNNNFIMNLTNAIVVIGSGGLLYNQAGGAGYYPNCAFSGPISLGGIVRLYNPLDYAARGNMPLYQGPITINQSNYWSAGLSKAQGSTSTDFHWHPIVQSRTAHRGNVPADLLGIWRIS